MSNFHSADCSKLSRVSSNLLNRGKFRFSGGSWHGWCTLHTGDKVTRGGTMKRKQVRLKSGLALLALATFFCFAKPAGGQSAPAQNRPVQDNDTTRQELANFDKFLDSHREIAEQLR